jgi:hypothetical protein
MNKDIIYIDTEDDITTIIGKIKASNEKNVDLVPPKRIGIMQSAVNLRLLERMAETSHKKLAIITSNKTLTNLAAAAKIPVSKNLQTEPEIAEIDALEIDDGDDVDIIDGSKLPVGELIKTTDHSQSNSSDNDIADAVDEIDVEDEMTDLPPAKPSAVTEDNRNDNNWGKNKKIKVPDYQKFRKKLFIGILLVIFLGVFITWAVVFAPAAKVTITAKTSIAPVSLSVKLSGTATTDITKGTIQTIVKQQKKDASIDFTATGSEVKGNKATGTLTLTRSLGGSISVPAGTSFSNGNYTFVTTADVKVPGRYVPDNSDSPVNGTVDVPVASKDIGPEYNLSQRSYEPSLDGITAYGSQMSGGSRQTVTIVTADDVQKASEALVKQSSDDIKKQLTSQFTNGETVVGDSFTADRAAAVSSPAVGAEATDGKAKLTSATTYSLTAIAKSELQTYLDASIAKQMDKNKQRVYDDGINNVKLSGYQASDQGATVNIAATGQIGPKIDQDSIKKQIEGKHFGDVQSLLEGIDGVNNVDVKFSYFWVTTVPNDPTKITIEFKIENA